MRIKSAWAGFVVVAAFFATAITGCNESPGVTDPINLNSNTNWLVACSADVDCSEDSACFCGQCTTPCASDGDCDVLGGGTCAAPEDRGDFCADDPGSLCLPSCETDDECGASYLCIDDVCEPAWSAPTGCALGQRVCGSALGQMADYVLECQDGEYVRIETCDDACLMNPGRDAACVSDCETGVPDAICGSELGLEGDALYNCGPNNRYALMSDCPFGCLVQDGVDTCGGQP